MQVIQCFCFSAALNWDLEVCHFFKYLEPAINIISRYGSQSVQREVGNSKRGEHCAVRDGGFDRVKISMPAFREIAHKASRKAVAGAGGVTYIIRRIGRQDELISSRTARYRAGFAFLDNHEIGPHLQDDLSGPDEIVLGRQ
jgi:hypothetical protein